MSLAGGGSLFLDEVDSLSPGSQAELLRLLQEKGYRPLGAQRSIETAVRFIAASSQIVPSGAFLAPLRTRFYPLV
jgi:transcriptional regulator with PAS, ATPase and Fis domain